MQQVGPLERTMCKELWVLFGQPPVRNWGPQSTACREQNPSNNHVNLEVGLSPQLILDDYIPDEPRIAAHNRPLNTAPSKAMPGFLTWDT